MTLTIEQLTLWREYAECHSNPMSQADVLKLFDTLADRDERIRQLEALASLLIEHLERYLAQYPPEEWFVIRYNPQHDLEYAKEKINALDGETKERK